MAEAAAHGEQQRVRVSLAERSYEILVGQNLIQNCAPHLQQWSQARQGRDLGTVAIVTDTNVLPYARQVEQALQAMARRVIVLPIEPGEPSKSLGVISQLWDQLVESRADRSTLLIAVGGGVVGDAAGFVAATFARGLPFAQIPTTLLADVDSSVGGKVGINHPQAKNLIGAFHQPWGVLIDTDALATLPDREYRAGLAEVVKYGMILDAEFFSFLEQHVPELNARDPATLRRAIARSCELKADVVERDEFERTGLRAVLNYGHTFAHAFEALTGYGELLHGEAVSIGMDYAARLAAALGRVDQGLVDRQRALLEALNLPVDLPEPERLTTSAVLERMRLDKKSVSGNLRFVLPSRLGCVELVDNVPEAEVLAVLSAGGISTR